MQILQIIFIVTGLIASFVAFGLMMVAYGKRKNKSFWSGAHILGVGFLLFPYGKNGVPETEKTTVFWLRVSVLLMGNSWWLAFVCTS